MYPSWRQTTDEALSSHKSLQTVPHLLLTQTSRRPSDGTLPPTSLAWPSLQIFVSDDVNRLGQNSPTVSVLREHCALFGEMLQPVSVQDATMVYVACILSTDSSKICPKVVTMPDVLYLRLRQTAWASFTPKLLLHTAPHVPLLQTWTLPLELDTPPARRTAPSVQRPTWGGVVCVRWEWYGEERDYNDSSMVYQGWVGLVNTCLLLKLLPS